MLMQAYRLADDDRSDLFALPSMPRRSIIDPGRAQGPGKVVKFERVVE